MLARLVYSASIILLSLGGAIGQEDEEFSRQELFSAVRLTTPGETLTSLPAKFAFPEHARDTSTFGIDVSHHNIDGCRCTIDWAEIAGHKVQFVYIKATQGIGYRDPTFVDTAIAARDQGKLAVGAYHFLTVDDPQTQVDNFVAQTAKAGELALMPSLDLEWDLGPMRDNCPSDAVITIKRGQQIIKRCDKWSTLSSSAIRQKASDWINAVTAATGRPVSLYTNAAWWNARVGKAVSPSEIGASVIWIADYSKKGLATEVPRTPADSTWAAWQFTDSAKIHSGDALLSLDASIMSGNINYLLGAQ